VIPACTPDGDCFFRGKLWQANEWNEYRILRAGRRIQLWLNGERTVDYTEPRPKALRAGAVGLQIAPSRTLCEVWYEDTWLRQVPPGAPQTAPAE